MLLFKCLVVILFFIVVETEAGFYRHDYNCSSEHNYCYKVHEVRKTWQEARKQCFFEGAILASPINESLYDMLKSVIDQSRPKAYYVGVHATFYPGDWNSVEGIPLIRFSNDLRDIVLDSSERQCGVMPDANTIMGTECDERYPFICYVPNNKAMELVKPQNSEVNSCGTSDKGYTLDNVTGKCYKFHKNLMTWSEAFHVCNAELAHLAVINSKHEAEVIHDIYNENIRNNPYNIHGSLLEGHIGVVDWERNGNYYLVTGEQFEPSKHFDWPDQGDPVSQGFYYSKRYFGCINSQVKLVVLENLNVLPFICEKYPQM